MTPTQQTILTLLLTALALPLGTSVLLTFATRRLLFRAAGPLSTLVMAGGFACSVYALWLWYSMTPEARTPITWSVQWVALPSFGDGAGLYLGVLIDGLTMAMMPMVTLISSLVHLYSIGYMHGDKRYNRFFSYLSLFTFSMLGIVLGNSIITLFVFWELVGLTSYLLIGFWFEKRGPQLACKKAFVMNRVGDMGFLVGFGILFYKLGGQLFLPGVGEQGTGGMFEAIQLLIEANGNSVTHPGSDNWWLTAAGIGLFFGAIGKSAQFPLHTWLPDAMEGPTPVSSIVHSATMVAAGVYLTGRLYPILTPGAHLFIATIGLVTLVMAACMALVMTDIKRVLAYSTLSQLGYMILGLGAGAYTFALFHLITHAFFKCCLFQCSGSVIHAAHHEQDMRQYGGLIRKMPITALCYFICTLAIAGASVPFTYIAISGYFSKDGIIAGTINYGEQVASVVPWAHLFFWGPTAVAYLTVFYMARSFALTFLGKPRNQHLFDHAHEAPASMLIPQAVLALMAILSVPSILPFLKLITDSTPAVDWVQQTADLEHGHAMHLTHAYLLQGLAWVLMLVAGIAIYSPGMVIASKIASLPGVNLLYKWAHNKFYFDALYDVFGVACAKGFANLCGAVDKYLVDGLVNLAGYVGRGAAWAAGLFDNQAVDGAVAGAAALATSSGNLLRSTQPGRIRIYVLMLFSSATLVTLMVVIAAVALR